MYTKNGHFLIKVCLNVVYRPRILWVKFQAGRSRRSRVTEIWIFPAKNAKYRDFCLNAIFSIFKTSILFFTKSLLYEEAKQTISITPSFVRVKKNYTGLSSGVTHRGSDLRRRGCWGIRSPFRSWWRASSSRRSDKHRCLEWPSSLAAGPQSRSRLSEVEEESQV